MKLFKDLASFAPNKGTNRVLATPFQGEYLARKTLKSRKSAMRSVSVS